MFSQACVTNSVHRGRGRCTPPEADTPRETPQVDTPSPPSGQTPLPIRRPLQQTVRILLECILVYLFLALIFCFFIAVVGFFKFFSHLFSFGYLLQELNLHSSVGSKAGAVTAPAPYAPKFFLPEILNSTMHNTNNTHTIHPG